MPRTCAAHGEDRLVAVIQALRGRALRRCGQGGTGSSWDLLDAMEVVAAEPGLDTVEVAAALAAASALGHYDDVEELTAQAIALAEGLDAGNRLLSDTFDSRGLMLNEAGRRLESIAYFRQSLAFAEAADDVSLLVTPLTNLADVNSFSAPREALAFTRRSMDVARQVGSRYGMAGGVANAVLCLLRIGEWGTPPWTWSTRPSSEMGWRDFPEVTVADALIRGLRGDPAASRRVFRPMFAAYGDDQAGSLRRADPRRDRGRRGRPRRGAGSRPGVAGPHLPLAGPLRPRLAAGRAPGLRAVRPRGDVRCCWGCWRVASSARSRRWSARSAGWPRRG